jgi:hypothetical protein
MNNKKKYIEEQKGDLILKYRSNQTIINEETQNLYNACNEGNSQLACSLLHLFSFKTPILLDKKIKKKHKINSRNFTYDGLTFSSSF